MKGRKECKSHCKGIILDQEYERLWEFGTDAEQLLSVDTTVHVNDVSPSSESNEPECSDDDDDDDGVDEYTEIHNLPFKVLGTCWTKERQKILENAYEAMYSHNRYVFARVLPESDNSYDERAIAVYVMSDDIYEKVGYIPSELTGYVHQCINLPDFKRYAAKGYINIKRETLESCRLLNI
ncbi:hypothetical protein AC249_AIPGENE8692 [Exaiptasia diaphana]|nr:hypothetical protein AC249_AIPGENE8692 [Exaiptasia diaphana]